eukprot:9465977-Alexandrium_andersonii.AAC.1
MGRWGLRNHLGPQLLRHSRAEVDRGRLVVRLEQDLAVVPQSVDAGHSLIQRVVAQTAFARDWVGWGRSGGATRKHKDGD